MTKSTKSASRFIPVSTIALSALLLSALPLLAGCEGGGTTNRVLLEHSGGSADSTIRQHHNH